MDSLIESKDLTLWLMNYGSITLFVLLTLGIIALPVPEETMLVLAGALMSKGQLHIPQTILAAFLGSLCGITSSYLIGRTAGHFLVAKYGKWVGIGPKQLDKAHAWFERFGKWTLFIGYFIPGVRHLTGLSAGITVLEFKEFALFAYTGALVWVSTFLSIGYFFCNYCFALYENIEFNDIYIFVAIILLIGAYLIYSKWPAKDK